MHLLLVKCSQQEILLNFPRGDQEERNLVILTVKHKINLLGNQPSSGPWRSKYLWKFGRAAKTAGDLS